jgi:predicted Rossmann fold flavoprotein
VGASAGGVRFENAMLITHRGLSGPAVLQISNYWQPGQKKKSRPRGAPATDEGLRIDLMPGGDALAFLLERQAARPLAELRTVLAEALPKRFAERFCELLAPSQPLNRYKRDELRAIADKLHDWPVVPSGTEGYRTAEVTLGGIDTREISSASFESQRVPGLYFIGEVLDVTGWLGGYNFQWAWASAHACGTAI